MTSKEYDHFKGESDSEILNMGQDLEFVEASREWHRLARKHKYSYHFEFAGRPLIQYPQDIVAVQEIVWNVRPDLIIETGIAHGGSLAMSAGMLALLDLADSTESSQQNEPALNSPRRKVIGIDIDIREHNRIALESHPFFPWMDLVQGSSSDPTVVEIITSRASNAETVLVMLDSNHTHEHVLSELHAYAQLVSKGSFCIVFDTAVEFLGSGSSPNRPWGRGNSPWSAVKEFLGTTNDFVVDESIEAKLGITVAPGGYLRRI